MTIDGLRLSPFRGLRYAPGKVGSLAAVTSPPYDVVVRPDEVHHLETADPYNIVRLILPQDGDAAGRQAKAAATLRSWRAEGVLAQERRPALYVYEQRRGDLLQRGLIGALRLSAPEEGVVLPHEDVIAEVVEDRAALMRATGANLEPLLLSYRGDGSVTGATAVIERAVLRTPLLSTTTEDGFSHRLWSLTDPAELAEIDADLSRHRALIADGHHRWATYLRLRGEHRERAEPAEGSGHGGPRADAGPGDDRSDDRSGSRGSPWDHGLVLLVDTVRHPLRVQAIHRVLPRLPLERALHAAESEGAFRVRALGTPTLAQALSTLDEAPGNAFLLTGGGAFHLLTDPSPRALDGLKARGPEPWRRLDATVLHSVLLDEVWRVPDVPEEISYIHDAAAAVGKASRAGGTAVLMRPVREDVVRELAEQGVMMPRKSTSFGPKPATGLVLRVLDDD